MPWVRIDEGMPEHPKVAALPDAAFRLHIEGLCYCARMLTDGAIPEVIAQRLGTKKACKDLVKSGLWKSENDGGFRIHDYLDFQPSREDVEDRRNKRSQAGKRGAQSRWGRRETMANPMASAIPSAMANGWQTEWQNDAPDPDPVHKPSLSVSPSPLGGSDDSTETVPFEIRDKTISPGVVSSIERLVAKLPDADRGTVGRLVKFAKAGAAQADFEDARMQVMESAPRSPSRVACHVIADRLRARA
jgi:hypothetical protein